MCGFIAVIGRNGNQLAQQALASMTAALTHRGPDDEGSFVCGNTALGFRRLSILDLEKSGHQPMQSADGRYVIVFNGEIYNYLELRVELKGFGWQFKSSGDTEVLLAAYQQWGTDCLQRLNGMWAFLILDCQTGTSFGSRDRFGVKPLFLMKSAQWTVFASEIKAIRDSGLAKMSVNWNAVANWLLGGVLDNKPQTFLSEIENIPAGTAFEVQRSGHVRVWRYWNVFNDCVAPTQLPQEQFRDLFDDAVRLRMRSDVPVGVLLSGGLDSTAIFCSMARQLQDQGGAHRLAAFSFMAQEYDESMYIHETLKAGPSILHRLDFTLSDLWDEIDTVLSFQDEPVHSATPVIGFKLMELASARGTKVLLNGQGADEVLAGYSSYFHTYWSSLLASGKFGRAWSEIRSHAARHRNSQLVAMLTAASTVYRSKLRELSVYRSLTHAVRSRIPIKHLWFKNRLLDAFVNQPSASGMPDLQAELTRSVEHFPLPLYLRIEDRNSMAHSVEVRLPFLDYRLVSLAFQLADDWKLDGPWNKRLLRSAMQGRIPELVRTRVDKMGFPIPIDNWFRGAWYQPMKELLNDPVLRDAKVCDLEMSMQIWNAIGGAGQISEPRFSRLRS